MPRARSSGERHRKWSNCSVRRAMTKPMTRGAAMRVDDRSRVPRPRRDDHWTPALVVRIADRQETLATPLQRLRGELSVQLYAAWKRAAKRLSGPSIEA